MSGILFSFCQLPPVNCVFELLISPYTDCMPHGNNPTLRCHIECLLFDVRGRGTPVPDDCDGIWHRKRPQEALLYNWMG